MVIEVPAPLGLRPGGLERAPDALRRAGLHERLGSPDAVRIELDGFWVHLDVDVLDDALMSAVDYRYPGGLCWNEAAEILGGLVADGGARGVEVSIFHPHLDPSAAIARGRRTSSLSRCCPGMTGTRPLSHARRGAAGRLAG